MLSMFGNRKGQAWVGGKSGQRLGRESEDSAGPLGRESEDSGGPLGRVRRHIYRLRREPGRSLYITSYCITFARIYKIYRALLIFIQDYII